MKSPLVSHLSKALFASTLGLLLLGSAPAPAEPANVGGFRCPTGRIVSIGDHIEEVRDKCGDPDWSDERVELRKVAATAWHTEGRWGRSVREERVVEIRVEEWMYDTGRHRLVRFLTFEQGRFIGSRTGSRGSR